MRVPGLIGCAVLTPGLDVRGGLQDRCGALALGPRGLGLFGVSGLTWALELGPALATVGDWLCGA